MPRSVVTIHREHVEAFVEDQLVRLMPASAANPEPLATAASDERIVFAPSRTAEMTDLAGRLPVCSEWPRYSAPARQVARTKPSSLPSGSRMVNFRVPYGV
jgi:hypothetical protein